MDKVRFGRALGYGARHAARALVQAADAATSPPSNAPSSRPSATASQTRLPTLDEAGSRVLEAHRTVTDAKQRVRTQAKAAGRSAFAPLKRAGGVLWLELTGTVFGLFAIFMAPGLWRLRGALHTPNAAEAHKLYGYTVVFLLFAYFAISSFVRARRRGRRL